ncbi:MAG: hypothetical protein Q9163_002281 [Psora crenata]
MFSKVALSLSALVAARLALAQPYCLLSAVNKFEHPADQKTLCCTEASQVKSYLSELCPSAYEKDAVTAFETACKQAGFECLSKSTSAPFPVSYTSTFYDTECSCTKTQVLQYVSTENSSVKAIIFSDHSFSTTALPGSTGFATGTGPVVTGTAAPSGSLGSGPGATSPSAPIVPVAPPGGLGSGPGASATGTPIVPLVAPSTTGSPSSFTGAGTKNVGSVAVCLLAVAGFAFIL